MFKKTMFVVGAIVAATMSMPDAASAAPRHIMRFQRVASAARAPRRMLVPLRWTSARLRRPARGRLVATRYQRLVAPVVPAYREVSAQVSAWHRLARRGRAASIYRPVMVEGPRRALAWHRLASRARLASAFRPIAPRMAAIPTGAAAPARAGVQTGRASFYHGGGLTAAGGHVGAATCAHRWLPFGTKVLVTNLANARRAVLTVNDRGPFVGGRIVDVSAGAAGILGMLHSGTAPVSVQVVGGRG